MVRTPATGEIANDLVQGFLNDGLLDPSRDSVELVRRIADVLDGERAEWRKLFEFYVSEAELAEAMEKR